MAAQELQCWSCGSPLAAVPLPFGRSAECPACASSLHCCRQCRHYQPGAPKDCSEPQIDDVSDKEATNFCDFFQPRGGLAGRSHVEADSARAKLAAVFGPKPGAGKPRPNSPPAHTASPEDAEAQAARKKLESMFGKK